ncbi:lipoyl synthase [Chondromyces crocatus]|uniref:Lipoyl synthase n=1 Tax=Chondromyces crocatus TaxID=52 RepID=A0A0K1END1_CHOCO|nr:lipoyl synthase [Chondromyces crocatus]AKT42440.1 lipoyl synthase [Chondromyces crocatus]
MTTTAEPQQPAPTAGTPTKSRFEPKPEWLKVRAPGGDTYHEIKGTLRKLDLFTVCEEARCPNIGECWREGTATVMLLGDVCTRGCRFCAVTTGDPRGAVDVREPEHVARAIARMGLQYVVMTMVNRDDLLDGGAEHVGRTVQRLRALRPDMLIETLVGDFQGHMSHVDTVVESGPDVFAHNIEVVRRLTRTIRDVRAGYDQSLEVLRRAKAKQRALSKASEGDGSEAARRLTKSSIMVGLGETDEELLETLRDLREAEVDVVTLGQYLRPSPKYAPVKRFMTPDEFTALGKAAMEMGFLYAASAPLVRSSYKAAEVFIRSALRGKGEGGEGAEALLDERLAIAQREAARVAAELGPETETRTPAAPRETPLIPMESLIRR